MELGFDQRTVTGTAGRVRRTQTTRHRAEFATDTLRRIVAGVIERECGVAPRVARPGSFARRSYAACLIAIRRDARALNTAATRGTFPKDARAAAVFAAHRACWREMRAGDGLRARFRSQVRCILALTPGYAIWRGLGVSEPMGRRNVQWLGGRVSWRTQRLQSTNISGKRSGMPGLAELNDGFGFDAVRRAVLRLVDETGAPVTIEQIVTALHDRFTREGGHS